MATEKVITVKLKLTVDCANPEVEADLLKRLREEGELPIEIGRVKDAAVRFRLKHARKLRASIIFQPPRKRSPKAKKPRS